MKGVRMGGIQGARGGGADGEEKDGETKVNLHSPFPIPHFLTLYLPWWSFSPLLLCICTP